jgi:hypothetical protein
MNQLTVISVLALGSMMVSCSQSHPKIAAPSAGTDGVQMALLDVKCSEEGESDNGRDLHVTLKIAVSNTRDAPVQFFPDRIRLLEPHALPPVRTESSSSIEKGQQRIVWAEFEESNGRTCTDPMRLDAADSLICNDRTARMSPVAFVAEAR